MARIFNTIRQRLLNENRFSRYLVYAIGEIVLVMVGILLALQVNNWNNDRANRAKEVKYLGGLKADLQTDLVNLKEFMVDKDVKATSALRLLRLVDPVSAAEIHFADSVTHRLFTWNTFNPSTKTMDELIGSGNLSLIQNDSVKMVMLDIQHRNELLAVHTEHMRREYEFYLYDRSSTLREMSPFLDLETLIEHDHVVFNIHASDTELVALRTQFSALLHELTFRNGLKLAILNNHSMRTRSEVLYAQLEHLIVLIDMDLKNAQ